MCNCDADSPFSFCVQCGDSDWHCECVGALEDYFCERCGKQKEKQPSPKEHRCGPGFFKEWDGMGFCSWCGHDLSTGAQCECNLYDMAKIDPIYCMKCGECLLEIKDPDPQNSIPDSSVSLLGLKRPSRPLGSNLARVFASSQRRWMLLSRKQVFAWRRASLRRKQLYKGKFVDMGGQLRPRLEIVHNV